MSSLKKNVVFNLFGKTWGAIINIILVPLYIKYLGIESYGLIGFFAMLVGSFSILDLGLGTTINRELAGYRAVENPNADNIRNLTFSLESIYWSVGIVIGLLVAVLSGLIAVHWVNVEELSADTVRNAVLLMGGVLVFQWPINYYNHGLTGLEKLVVNNTILIVMTTVRSVGALLVLSYISPTITAFFAWQAGTSFLHVFLMRWALWSNLPKSKSRRIFSKDQLKSVSKFAAGMTGISLVTFFLSHVDKVLLSKLLSLSAYGYYTLALALPSAITMIISPVCSAFFPRLSALVKKGDTVELKKIYHNSSAIAAALIFPISFILIFFSYEILMLWTGDATTTENTYLVAGLLTIGSMFNSLMVMPYYLLISHGWTKFTIYQNSIAAVVLVPSLFVLTSMFEALGAAIIWATLNIGYFIISQPIMHRTLLKGELRKWYLKDTLLTMLPSLGVVLLCKFILVNVALDFSLLVLIAIALLSLGFSGLAINKRLSIYDLSKIKLWK